MIRKWIHAFGVALLACGLCQPAEAQPSARTISPSGVTTTLGSTGLTDRRADYLAASGDLTKRIVIVEAIGEEGAAAWARQNGLGRPILLQPEKSSPQGFDQVWKGADGTVHVVEAKGGNSPLNSAYGEHQQGTMGHTIRAAERVLERPGASEAERRAAREVLEAADRNLLEVHVVRTPHVLGRPSEPMRVGHADFATPAERRLARSCLERWRPRGTLMTGALPVASAGRVLSIPASEIRSGSSVAARAAGSLKVPTRVLGTVARVTIAVDAATVLYDLANEAITPEDALARLAEGGVKAAATTGATAIIVACGATPVGLVVLTTAGVTYYVLDRVADVVLGRECGGSLTVADVERMVPGWTIRTDKDILTTGLGSGGGSSSLGYSNE